MNKIPLKHLSPLPVVDLMNISEPAPGMSCDVPTQCIKNFTKSDACKLHYQQLLNNPAAIGKFTQCPYGFSTYVHSSASSLLALTSLVPWPRMGGEAERRMSKSNKSCKIARDRVVGISNALQETEGHLAELEKDTIQRNSLSLHEARKFNRTIKQTAERICRKDNPNNPNQAKPEFVKIWKAAEMMSTQFEILELIANENLTQLPINSTVEFFPLAHKVVHLYSDRRTNICVELHSEPKGVRGSVKACDKTIHIIPTVLIDNAIKYAEKDTSVDVCIREHSGKCSLEVTNYYRDANTLTADIFERGVRASTLDGTGFGLYLAQLVAKQHSTVILLDTCFDKRIRFSVEFPIASS